METTERKDFAPLSDEAKVQKLIEIREKYKGAGRQAQRTRLLSAIRQFPVSTIEARQFLDIMHPAGRVKELRECGWRIDTHWISQETDCGRRHRVALYIYKGRADG